jgi:hypothetical protein
LHFYFGRAALIIHENVRCGGNTIGHEITKIIIMIIFGFLNAVQKLTEIIQTAAWKSLFVLPKR